MTAVPSGSPDGSQIAFLPDRADEVEVYLKQKQGLKQDKREPKFQIWILNLQQGGEARQVTSCSEGVEYDEEAECYHWGTNKALQVPRKRMARGTTLSLR